MVDRSKRYEKSEKKSKKEEPKKEEMQDRDEQGAEAKARETAGDPPTDGENKKADKGPEAGSGPAISNVAEHKDTTDRHKSEMLEMSKRHVSEMEDMHDRHRKERGDMGRRHAREMAPNNEETLAEKGVEKKDEGPKLGKAEEKKVEA